MEEYDFIIIGAGLSGVDAGYRLKTQLPQCTYTILEAREEIGGTWSFFKFPGVRSDSDATLLGFSWRPWPHEVDMADAHLIREYIEDAARSEGIDKKIQFGNRVTGANWSSEEQRWTLSVLAGDVGKEYKGRFLLACTGYYDYTKPLQAEIPGVKNFRGTVAHPQFWPEDLDYAGKRVIIIGSGATAATMVPTVAKTAKHVTMLQRSPSYVMSLPLSSPVNAWLKKYFPESIAHTINWWIALLMENVLIVFSLKCPKMARNLLMKDMKAQMPEKIDVDVHFNPRYDPWDQRVNMCPDGNFFKAMHQDNCDVVTDRIETVTEDGILTESGKRLEADIIVTATGLHLHLFGGISPVVDGNPVDIGSRFCWRGCMLSGLPNAGVVTGYTTNSWTLGADASIKMLIKVWNHMKKLGATSVTPVHDENDPRPSKPIVAHSSTYFVMARSRFPKITDESPWYGRKNVVFDYFMLWFGSMTNGLKYTIPSKKNE